VSVVGRRRELLLSPESLAPNPKTQWQVNDEELERMAGWLGCSTDEKTAAALVAKQFNIDVVCITRGGDGACVRETQ
jgi:sugar/nucleoside kinase (ribokinase family)